MPLPAVNLQPQFTLLVPALAPSLPPPHPIQALCNFSSSEAFRSRIIESGALSRLVAAWVGGEETMKDEIAVALCQLASDDTRVALVTEGALPAVLSLAPASTRPVETQQLCARTLVLLSSVEDSAVTMMHDGVVSALEVLSSSVDAVTKLLVACVLVNLAKVKVLHAMLIKDDAIKTLIPLTLESKAETRR